MTEKLTPMQKKWAEAILEGKNVYMPRGAGKTTVLKYVTDKLSDTSTNSIGTTAQCIYEERIIVDEAVSIDDDKYEEVKKLAAARARELLEEQESSIFGVPKEPDLSLLWSMGHRPKPIDPLMMGGLS